MYWQIIRRIHRTWQVLALCMGFVAGVAVAPRVGWVDIPIIVAGILLGATSFWRSRRIMLVAAIIGGLLIGIWHGSVAHARLEPMLSRIGERAVLSGVVLEDTTESHGKQAVKLGKLRAESKQIDGTLWVSVDKNRDIKRSDSVTVDGVFREGFAGYTASMYDAAVPQHTRETHGDVALELRDGFAAKIRGTIDEPMASLGLGFLVGQKNDLPPQLAESLKIAGLTHIVVASGYNLTVIIRLARRLLEKHSKYLATALPMGLMLGFVAVTGASPSMSRAGLVTAMGLVAWYMGRTFHPVSLLAYAATISLIVKPSYAWGDIGWLLSFSAFAGVMLLAPLLHAYFFGDAKPSLMRQTIVETTSAQIMTAPILIVTFGQLSVIAILSNLLVLPLVPIVMLLTFIAGIVVLVLPSIQLIGLPAELIMRYMIGVVDWSARQPWATWEASVPLWGAAITYVCITLAMLYMRRASGYRLHRASIVE